MNTNESLKKVTGRRNFGLQSCSSHNYAIFCEDKW